MGVAYVTLDNPPANSYDLDVMRKFAADVDAAVGSDARVVIEPFQRMIEAGELVAYRHNGFFRAMDTLKDKQILEDMVEQGKMPWQPKMMHDARPAEAAQ